MIKANLSAGMSSSQTHEMLEQENDEMDESLGRKVAALKSVSSFNTLVSTVEPLLADTPLQRTPSL